MGAKTVLHAIVQRLENNVKLHDAIKQSNDAADKQDAGKELSFEEIAALRSATDRVGSTIGRSITSGVGKAVRDAETHYAVIRAMGWGRGESDFRRLPFEKKVELLNKATRIKINIRLNSIIRNAAKQTLKRKLENARTELQGVIDREVISCLPSQDHAGLSQEELEELRKIAERKLLQKELRRHRDEIGKGPMIVLINDSDPMSCDVDEDGTRREYALATGLGLAAIAQHDHRNFAWNVFSSCSQMITGEFPNGQASSEDMLKLFSAHMGGGTEFEGPLQWGMEKIVESKYKNADVFLITADKFDISDEFEKKLIALKQKKNFRVWMIQMGVCDVERDRLWFDGVWKDMSAESIEEMLFRL